MKLFRFFILLLILSLFSTNFVYAQDGGGSPLADRTWIRLGGPQGGLGYDIRMDPRDPEIMYVTDAWAGIHKSIDGGQTWFQINNGIDARSGESGDAIPAFSISIDPNNPDILWAGMQAIRGIYRSIDAGSTWEKKISGIIEEGITFRGFTVDPTDSSIVYAAGELPSYTWAGRELNGLAFDKTKGVLYRTMNSGDSWEKIWEGDNLARYVWIDPRNHEIIYMSTGIFDRESANTNIIKNDPGGLGILKSDDFGETWKLLNNDGNLPGLYVGSLYMHPENPDILLAAVGHDVWSLFRPHSPSGILLSSNGGENWDMVLKESHGVMMSVEFCTSNPDIAYAAGDHYFYHSTDGGHTWENPAVDQGYWGPPGIVGSQPIDIQCDPRNPERLFINNYVGGNFISEDGGATWQTASNGYTGAQITGQISVNPNNPAQIYVGARSGLFRSDNGGFSWQGLGYEPVRLNEVYAHASDPSDFNYVLNAPADLDSMIAWSDDGGHTWRKGEDGVSKSSFTGEKIKNRYVTDIDFDVFDSNRVYATLGNLQCLVEIENCESYGGGLYRSDDRGKTWLALSGEKLHSLSVLSIEINPQDSQNLFISTVEEGLLVSNDGGETWNSANLPNLRIVAIEVDPSQPNRVIVGTMGEGVFISEDGAKNWKKTSAGLEPQGTVKSIVFDTARPGIIYLAEALSGVFLSQDSGQTWKKISDGLSYRAVYSLALSADGNTLYAGTNGGGVYRLSSHDQAYFDSMAPSPTNTPEPTNVPEKTVNHLTQTPNSSEPAETAMSDINYDAQRKFSNSRVISIGGISIGVALVSLVVYLIWIRER